MSFWKRLFGGESDPTADWPQLAPAPPTFDLRTLKIGPLVFGSPPAEAQVFGKPDACERGGGSNPGLLHARSGYLLEYEEGRLVFVTFFTGPDEFAPKHPAMALCRPRIQLPDGTVRELHADSEAEALVAIFGKPESAEVDEDESILEWERGELTIEAELSERGRLRRLNIFLTH